MSTREVTFQFLAIVALCCMAGGLQLALLDHPEEVVFLRADHLTFAPRPAAEAQPVATEPASKTALLPTVSEFCEKGQCDLEGLNVVIFISAEAAWKMWESGEAQFVDARGEEDFNAGHIEFATHLAVADFQSGWPEGLDYLMKELVTVVYCDGVACDSSRLVARNLVRAGYKQVRIIEGGISNWRAAGYPVEVTE